MIITDTLTARGVIDMRLTDDPRALDAMAGEVGKEVIAIGETVGAFIRPQSVYFTKHDIEDGRMQCEVVGVWAPDPKEGVELRGGALDGQVIQLNRSDGARPPLRWRVPIPQETMFVSTEEAGPVSTLPVADYERAGIDSERDRWVYQAV